MSETNTTVDKVNNKVVMEHKAIKTEFEFEGQVMKLRVSVDTNKDGQPSLINTTEVFLGESADEIKDAIFGGGSAK